MKKIIMLLAAALFCVSLYAVPQQRQGNILKETLSFADKDGQTLSLDKYHMSIPSCCPKPCILFMFGGAFARGERDRIDYIPYFHNLCEQGYVVVSIDYRLGLKDFDPSAALSDEEFIILLSNTVGMAVEDLYDATNFILERAEEWNVDPNMIIANGSSAGAVTVLQGEYEICNSYPRSAVLPEGFRYAGVISFAGAIFDFAPELSWNTNPCPIQMFHGDADMQVPYDAIVQSGAGFWGSAPISESLRRIGSPYYFYSVENTGHEMASVPIRENWEEITTFLEKYIRGERRWMMDTNVRDMDREDVRKDFTIEDYVRGNFVR